MPVYIGFDDTDSPTGGCTTYTACLVIEQLLRLKVKFLDFPRLIRLNPNVPYKTRGNGAVSLQVNISNSLVDYDELKEVVLRTIANTAQQGSDPCVVFLHTERIPNIIRSIGEKALHDLLNPRSVLSKASSAGCEIHALGSTLTGVIGAVAAIGVPLDDYTFELIAYRTRENWGKRVRKIDVSSVIEMDKKFRNLVFHNYDPETGRVLLYPRGPDPVLLGVRGETPGAVLAAFRAVRINEPVERWVIFRTNQATDQHVKVLRAVSDLRPYTSARIIGVVAEKPRIEIGGHVFFPIKDSTGSVLCAAYEPTGSFRFKVLCLRPGDVVEAWGGVRPPDRLHPMVLNLEGFRVLHLCEYEHLNPLCPRCGKRMTSLGRHQGFRCKRCRAKLPPGAKQTLLIRRQLHEGGIYLPPPRARRHLTKPLCRYGREKHGVWIPLTAPWHYP